MPRHPEPSDRLTAEEATDVFAALAQQTRLEAFRLLLRYQPFGLSAGDVARLLAVPHNTLSTHIAVLQRAGLVRTRRDGRSLIMTAVPARLAAAERYLAQGVAWPTRTRARRAANSAYPIKRPEDLMADKVHNVLILCTGNSARSILAEAIINREGQGRFRAFSAGSQPKGEPNPFALDLLGALGYQTADLRSKSWSEFAEPGAPKMDFIITVCDSAAGEACPIWPGHPLVAHWGIPDPAGVEGTAAQKRAAFEEAYRRLMSRVTALVNLPVESLPLKDLKARLAEIGRMDGATDLALTGKVA